MHGFIHHRDGLTYLIMGSGSRIHLRVVLGEQDLKDKLSQVGSEVSEICSLV